MTMRAVFLALAMILGLAAPAAAQVPARTIFYMAYDDGTVVSYGNPAERIPTQSQSKLLLGYYVLTHGTEAEKTQVEPMIAVSSDYWAGVFDRRYPQAIDTVAREWGLTGTSRGRSWGWATTTALDMARMMQIIRQDPLAAPLRWGMEHAAAVAADGYPQDYGTATIPGVRGTKFGWSDEGDTNITASYGDGWVAVANTYGTAPEQTADVQAALPAVLGEAAPETAENFTISLGRFEIPAVTGAMVKAKVRCVPLPLADTQLVPLQLYLILPRC
ncbi:MAG: hypothetical protein Q3972_03095 [Corynebacterium sp.]|nr:hypothetical protein [Corynebacterium sp.]